MTGESVSSHLATAFSRELVFALDIVEQAGKIAMRYFQRGVKPDTKDDGTPVTIADRECERSIRQALAMRFPDDAILGEEEGESPGSQAGEKGDRQSGSQRKWILDPIDGTYGYARGVPIFATLLALEVDGEVVLGVVSNPAAGDTYWAEKGSGAFKNGERIYVSQIGKVEESQLNFGGLNRILKLGYWKGFTKLVEDTCRQRGMGDYLGFAQVFEGVADAHIEVGVKPWDLAPMKIIVEEAGGAYSDLSGGKSVYTGDCLISNGLVHEQFLKTLLDR
ncbi:MAG TPA: inositol monophosphatase family protein [Chroococcales cyanobacterium]